MALASLNPPDDSRAPEGITHVKTTTQVLVHACTRLEPEDFITSVKARRARIKQAIVRWDYEGGAWTVGSVHIWGPVIRQSDGSESTQHVSELTLPPFASGARYNVITPPELVEVAQQNTPEWTPQINETQYSRRGGLHSSL